MNTNQSSIAIPNAPIITTIRQDYNEWEDENFITDTPLEYPPVGIIISSWGYDPCIEYADDEN